MNHSILIFLMFLSTFTAHVVIAEVVPVAPELTCETKEGSAFKAKLEREEAGSLYDFLCDVTYKVADGNWTKFETDRPCPGEIYSSMPHFVVSIRGTSEKIEIGAQSGVQKYTDRSGTYDATCSITNDFPVSN